jgi:hypothetical protein
MTRRFAALICGTALSAMSAAPAFAAEAPDVAKALVLTPLRLVAFSAGAVIGTPIAVLRKSYANTHETFSSKSDNKVMAAGTALAALPVGIFTGTLEGVFLGTKNSWMNSTEHPFGKDSFSLGEMKE